jgi:hypothetical protein
MAEGLRLAFAEGLAIEWPLDALMRSADAADPSAPPVWELAGELDWDEVESLRLITAAVGEAALAMVVVRPAGASDHGGDGIAAAIARPNDAEGAQEAFLSSEYDEAGALRRLGVELWLSSGAGKRIAADRAGTGAESETGALRRQVTPLAVRLDGEQGRGLHELVRPA